MGLSLQTRIPAGLASKLKQLVKDYDEDCAHNSEEEPEMMLGVYTSEFPSVPLLEAMKAQVQVEAQRSSVQASPLMSFGL